MRLFITFLSMGSVISFSYALAGYGGRLFDKGRADYVVFGLLGGFLFAGLALYLWKKNLPSFFLIQEDSAEDDPEAPPIKEEKTSPKKPAD